MKKLLLSLALLHSGAFAQTTVVGNGLTYANGSVTAGTAFYVGQTPVHPPGSVWVFMGDSITSGSAALSFATQASLLSSGALVATNKGVAGQLCSDNVARFARDVIALKPNITHILCGSNDVNAGRATALILADIRMMASAALAAGITPILGTVPPRVASAAGIAALNAGVAAIANRLGVQVVDYYAGLVDPSTRDYLAGTGAGDGIHPNAAGGRLMAAALLATAKPLLPTWTPYLERTGTDASNLLPNPLFLTNTTGYNASSDVVPTVVADATIGGQWARLTKTGGTNGYFNQAAFMTTGFSAGQTLAFSGRIRTTGVEAGGCTVNVLFWPYDVSTITTGSSTVLTSTADIASSVFYQEVVVPANTVKFNVGVQIQAGACVVDIAQLTLVNLSALGVL